MHSVQCAPFEGFVPLNENKIIYPCSRALDTENKYVVVFLTQKVEKVAEEIEY